MQGCIQVSAAQWYRSFWNLSCFLSQLLKPTSSKLYLLPPLLGASHRCTKPVQVRKWVCLIVNLQLEKLWVSTDMHPVLLLPLQRDLQQILGEQKIDKELGLCLRAGEDSWEAWLREGRSMAQSFFQKRLPRQKVAQNQHFCTFPIMFPFCNYKLGWFWGQILKNKLLLVLSRLNHISSHKMRSTGLLCLREHVFREKCSRNFFIGAKEQCQREDGKKILLIEVLYFEERPEVNMQLPQEPSWLCPSAGCKTKVEFL